MYSQYWNAARHVVALEGLSSASTRASDKERQPVLAALAFIGEPDDKQAHHSIPGPDFDNEAKSLASCHMSIHRGVARSPSCWCKQSGCMIRTGSWDSYWRTGQKVGKLSRGRIGARKEYAQSVSDEDRDEVDRFQVVLPSKQQNHHHERAVKSIT